MRRNVLLATPKFLRTQVNKLPNFSCRRSLSLTRYQRSGCWGRERAECFKFLSGRKLSSKRTHSNCSTANSSDEQGSSPSSVAAKDPSGISGQHAPQEAPTDDDANLANNHWVRFKFLFAPDRGPHGCGLSVQLSGLIPCDSASHKDTKARVKDQLQKHINQFDRSTSAVELQWCIGAVRHCANVLPPGSELSLKKRNYTKISTSHGNCEASFKVATRKGNVQLILSLRKTLRRVQQPSLDGIWPQSLLHYNVALRFDVAISEIRQSNSSITMTNEMRHVVGLIEAVDERVVQTFALESEHAFATTMAEALLRVVELQSHGLVLVSTRITTNPDNAASQAASSAFPAAVSVAEAKWESPPKHALNLEERKSRAVEISVQQDAEREDDMEDALDAREDKLADDESINDEEAVSADTTEAEKGPSHTSDVSDGKQPDSTISGATLVSSLLQSVEDGQAGLCLNDRIEPFRPSILKHNVDQCSISWDQNHIGKLKDLTVGDVTDCVENVLNDTKDTGSLWTNKTVTGIIRTLPGCPRVRLQIRVDDNSWIIVWAHHAVEDLNSALSNLEAHLVVREFLPNVRTKDWVEGTSENLYVQLSIRGNLVEHGDTITSTSGIPGLVTLLRTAIRPIVPQCSSMTMLELLQRCHGVASQLKKSIADTIDGPILQVRTWRGPPGKGRQCQIQQTRSLFTSSATKAYIALGSNVGDRFAAIEHACRAIDQSLDMRILRTSSLYETEPMYVEDQDRFLNGACLIETTLEPMRLLDRLQAIEKDLGRIKLIDKGPRNIDLDILDYESLVLDTERLTLPHRSMMEREFVLRPLVDVLGSSTYAHPVTGQIATRQLKELERLRDRSQAPEALTPTVPGCQPLRSGISGMEHPTLVMSILNVTPDSFSDGGDHQPQNLERLRATAASHIAAGATIIDVGGQSSRPGAVDITAAEELARVLPAIEAIKSLPEASKVAISVDTYRASVAKAAVEAGAHIVNDISAGTLDSEMLATVAELGCTYIMMHMRGTPSTMQNEENTRYPEGKLIETIASELNTRVRAAQNAGIRRWRIVLDPGVGFSKTIHQNLEILQDLQWLRSLAGLQNLPWLIGTSRKSFIGQITGAAEPKDRAFGTAAAVTAAIQGGASIVRVHDVAEMAQVVKMADAIFKARGSRDKAVKEIQEGGQDTQESKESLGPQDTEETKNAGP